MVAGLDARRLPPGLALRVELDRHSRLFAIERELDHPGWDASAAELPLPYGRVSRHGCDERHRFFGFRWIFVVVYGGRGRANPDPLTEEVQLREAGLACDR